MRNIDKEKIHMLYEFLLLDFNRLRFVAKSFIKGGDGRNYLNPYFIPLNLRRKMRILNELLYLRNGELNIFAEHGTKVIYKGRAVQETMSHQAGKKYLQQDKVYTVQTVTPHSCSTSVELQEVPGYTFCASAFKPYTEDKKSPEELLCEYGPDLEDDLEKAFRFALEYEAKKKQDALLRARNRE